MAQWSMAIERDIFGYQAWFLDVKSVKIPDFGLYVKKYNKNKKNLANIKDIRYTEKAVTLIAVKREVAV